MQPLVERKRVILPRSEPFTDQSYHKFGKPEKTANILQDPVQTTDKSKPFCTDPRANRQPFDQIATIDQFR